MQFGSGEGHAESVSWWKVIQAHLKSTEISCTVIE